MPVDASHSFTVLSREPDTMNWPSPFFACEHWEVAMLTYVYVGGEYGFCRCEGVG